MGDKAKHALLSPSGAHRWLNCLASAKACEHVPDVGSDFAAEGSLAHAYAARYLKKFLALAPGDEVDDIRRLKAYDSKEMAGYVQVYADYVIKRCTEAVKLTTDRQVAIETKLDLTDWIPEAYGTADAMIVADGLLEVIDLKYGKGIKVDAKDNPQLMCYALGAYQHWEYLYDVRTVRMTIVQPRRYHVSSVDIPVVELLRWGEDVLRPSAILAHAGRGGFASGEWCRFCPIRHDCKQRAMEAMATTWETDGAELTYEAMAKEVLPRLAGIKSWVAATEGHALTAALEGAVYPGWRVCQKGRNARLVRDKEEENLFNNVNLS